MTNNSTDSVKSFMQRKQSSSAFGSFFSSSSSTTTSASATASEARLRAIEVENSVKVGTSIPTILVDRIFLKSVQLSTNAIEDFVTALCQVSLVELNLPTTRQLRGVLRPRLDTRPRIFSLQRLVEVADFNMTIRPRFVWSRIWAVLSRHFATAGCHENVNVSLYAIDSLRQVCIYRSICISSYPYVSMYLSIYLSSIYLSILISLHFYVSIHPSMYISIHITCLFVGLSQLFSLVRY
jgi:Sec7-like guanine-nucleotide exchange factor